MQPIPGDNQNPYSEPEARDPEVLPPASASSQPSPHGLAPMLYVAQSKPQFTRILQVINVLVFLAMTYYGYSRYGTLRGTEATPILEIFGAKVNYYIAQGQVWRLLSAMFIHIGFIHLAFNLYALHSLGPLVEGFFGHRRFLAIYFIGGLWGSVASYAFSDALSAGASGAIFGLAGAAAVYFLKHRDKFGARGSAILQNIVMVMGINLFLGFSSTGIDNWGHMGGLVGGAAIAFGLLPDYRVPQVLGRGPQAVEVVTNASREGIWVPGHLVLLYLAVRAITKSFNS